MILIEQLRSDLNHVAERLKIRGIDNVSALSSIISLDDQRKSVKTDLDEKLNQRNVWSKEIGQLFKEGKTKEANDKKQLIADLKEAIGQLESDLANIQSEIHEALIHIPNLPHDLVAPGKSEADNVFVRGLDKAPESEEGLLPHWDLGSKYGLIDMELGVKITGSGFPVYLGKGALLQRALINFFLNEAIQHGYREIIPPLLVNEESAFGTGQLPDKEGQMYHAQDDALFLIPTAEVPLTNIYRDSILSESELPIKLVGYTPCFRREAGSYGKEVRGLNRVHQFDKVEIVQIRHPKESYDTLEEMVVHVESLLKVLELPYRIVRLCGGDLGFTSAMTYDFEVYSKAQKRWLEVSSVSNFETFQANRLKLRYKDAENKKHLLHTLNGSALALARIVATILENNQTPEGIVVPKPLRAFMNCEVIN